MTLFDAGLRRALEALSLQLMRAQGGGRLTQAWQGEARMEFAGLRPYVTGDDSRDLDWPAYARSERLYVRQRQREEGGHMLVWLDRSASMQAPTPAKWREARRAALALAYLGWRGGLTSRMCWSGGAGGLPPLQAQRDFRAWCTPLTSLETEPPGVAGGEALAGELPRGVPGGHGELVVVSDLLGRSPGADRLRAAGELGWRVTLVQVLSHLELVPPGPGSLRLEDPEGPEHLELEVGETQRREYETRLAALLDGWRRLALRHGMRYILCEAERGIVVALQQALGAGSLRA